MSKKLRSAFLFLPFIIIAYFICCTPKQEEQHSVAQKQVSPYFNHSDTAKYVGMTQCRLCHQQIYDSFMHTGMGMSFDTASKTKSSADFSQHPVLYDKYSDLYYQPYWDHEIYKVKEYRLEGKDTVYKNMHDISYIIGSGQHTNSHMINVNGYIYQAPLTYYTQDKRWDFPPGFENGKNSRFSRKIGLECMSCHNSFPDFVQGSENKYSSIPNGINCERCHGPGSIHVQQKTAGERIDTSKYIDFSIVNPGKLSVDLQFDLCQRCHLQGNTVLKDNKSFYDFKPGMKLSDVMTVFLSRYTDSETDFIMASHADRLKMSKCFLESVPKGDQANVLRPYKNSMTCVTCHNPHVSVKATGMEVFNGKCMNCHSTNEHQCTESESERNLKNNNCVSCHMPKSGSVDIPHVRITDHYIRTIVSKKEQDKVRKFISLYAVNEKNPSAKIIARGYINQYEKFEAEPFYLDSAKKYLKDITPDEIAENIAELVHLYYLRSDNDKIIKYVNGIGKEKLLNEMLIQKSFDNNDAWTNYRIGQALSNKGDNNSALRFYELAVKLAPFVSEFKNKVAGIYISVKQTDKAIKMLEEIIKEDPMYAPAFSNLGYVYLMNNDPVNAEINYNKALSLDPDYEQALLNKAALYLYLGGDKGKQAEKILLELKKKYPNNVRSNQLYHEWELSRAQGHGGK